MVQEMGLEPTRSNGHWLLRPACLPIPALLHFKIAANNQQHLFAAHDVIISAFYFFVHLDETLFKPLN
ncbi:MAG: hypothetical protein K0R09_3287 [Clostridiales bacterium]|nr:hypothetical protein [Clostridiales bacterium]